MAQIIPSRMINVLVDSNIASLPWASVSRAVAFGRVSGDADPGARRECYWAYLQPVKREDQIIQKGSDKSALSRAGRDMMVSQARASCGQWSFSSGEIRSKPSLSVRGRSGGQTSSPGRAES